MAGRVEDPRRGRSAGGTRLGGLVGLDDEEVADGGEDEERDECGDEGAERDASRLPGVEVGLVAGLADDAHDDVDHLLDDLTERAGDDEGHGKLDEVAPHHEVLETLHGFCPFSSNGT